MISYFDEPYIDAIIIVRQFAIFRNMFIARTRHSDKVVAHLQSGLIEMSKHS